MKDIPNHDKDTSSELYLLLAERGNHRSVVIKDDEGFLFDGFQATPFGGEYAPITDETFVMYVEE